MLIIQCRYNVFKNRKSDITMEIEIFRLGIKPTLS